MTKGQFSGVFIPREVLLDADISASGKIIFAIIQSLDNDKGCFASNDYIGTMLGLSESSVRASIGDLIKKNYITRFVDESGNRTIRTCTTISLADPQQKTGDTPPENKRTPRQKTGTYSNKDNNSDNKGLQSFLLPPIPHGEEFVPTWDMWVQYRKERKKPLTNQTVKLQLEFLTTLNHNDATISVLNSIKHGWLGLFAPNGKSNTSYYQQKPLTASDHETF